VWLQNPLLHSLQVHTLQLRGACDTCVPIPQHVLRHVSVLRPMQALLRLHALRLLTGVW